MRHAVKLSLAIAVAGLAMLPPRTTAQEHDADALAKQLANPVAALISVPFQLNFDTGYAGDGEEWLLNVQPVILVSLNDRWNLISRTILPLVSQSDVAGDDRPDVNSMFVQPFLTKGLGQGRTVALNTESTYDWERKQWTVPVNLGYSKVTKLGTQLVSWQGGVRGYLEAPDGGPDWGLRFTFTLLFPR